MRPVLCLLTMLALCATPVLAQESAPSEEAAAPAGAVEASPAKPAAGQAKPTPSPDAPAKQVFGALRAPNGGPSHVFGFYAKGCLSGGQALPITGTTWQAMRLSRNRNYGHPQLINAIQRLSQKVVQVASWPGLLIGDISQPRGGPMLTGHASHQIGLDADIWLTPMPKRELPAAERESMVPINVVAADWNDVDPAKWTPGHLQVIKAAAQLGDVERIFVNPAIKKALCREAGSDRGWLQKVRPMYGHNYHFHIRIGCPAGETACKAQAPTNAGDGCGADLAYWFSDAVRNPPKPKGPKKPPPPPMTLSALPAACQAVAAAP
jgi:penicillin-insensitive murein DD-endopeptidase